MMMLRLIVMLKTFALLRMVPMKFFEVQLPKSYHCLCEASIAPLL